MFLVHPTLTLTQVELDRTCEVVRGGWGGGVALAAKKSWYKMDLVKTPDRSNKSQKHAIYDLSTSIPAPSCCRLARLFTAVNVAQNAKQRGRAFELAVGAELAL